MAKMDITATIIKYEDQELEFLEVVDLFQELVNSGMVWRLQGSYGRTALGLIGSGFVSLPPDCTEFTRVVRSL